MKRSFDLNWIRPLYFSGLTDRQKPAVFAYSNQRSIFMMKEGPERTL